MSYTLDNPLGSHADTFDLLPNGLLVVDEHQVICTANKKSADIFGYEPGELEGKPLNILLETRFQEDHAGLVGLYLNDVAQSRPMALGRVVSGVSKNGNCIQIRIDLSFSRIEGKPYVFALVTKSPEQSRELHFLEDFSRLNRILSACNDGVWEWNINTGNVWFSPRFLKMLGVEPNQAPYSLATWIDHIHPDERDAINDRLQQHLDGRAEFNTEYRGRCADGDYQWFQVKGSATTNEQGSPAILSAAVSNIHESKLLELELTRKTQFHDVVINRTLAGVYIFDLVSSVNVFINSQYTRVTGYSLEELNKIQTDSSLMTLFHPEDVAAVQEHIGKVINSPDNSLQLEYRFRHRDGRWIWCLSMDSVYEKDNLGNPVKMLGSFVDITELKEREAKIERLARDFIATFEQAAVGIAHVGLDGAWIKVNEKLCEILRYPKESLLTKTFQEITYPDDLSTDVNHVNRLIEGAEENYSMEKRYICGDGSVIWANLTVSIVKDAEGNNSHFISVIEDICARKAIEDALEDSNRYLENFAYTASHDLQEPLRKIEGFSERLSKRFDSETSDRDALYEMGRIQDSAARMRDMINSLLELSRLSRGEPAKKKCTLGEILHLVKEDVSRLLQESGAVVTLKSDVELYVDRNNFVRVLSNLIINSIRYAKKDEVPDILVSGVLKAGVIVIQISDNGIGFKQEKAELIFEPFKRLVGRTYQGTGMGLAIARQILKAHNGSIRATSKTGEGATFTIELPVT